jgi:hypothetical protein
VKRIFLRQWPSNIISGVVSRFLKQQQFKTYLSFVAESIYRCLKVALHSEIKLERLLIQTD